MDAGVRFPQITVVLVEVGGSEYSVLGGVLRALKRAGAGPDQLRELAFEAVAGDYDHLLRTIKKWVYVI